MAVLGLEAAAAGTWIIPSFGDLSDSRNRHDVPCQPTVPDQFRHDFHFGSGVFKKRPVTLAEIVQARLSVGCFDETVPGTLAMAGKNEIAPAAVSGKAIPFVPAEFQLFWGFCKHAHRCLQDIAEQVIRLDEVIAGVEITVVFERHSPTAGTPENADGYRQAKPSGQCPVEVEHERPADIPAHPLVEDPDQEFSPLLGANRAICNLRSGLDVVVDTFDDWYELNVPGLDRVAKKTVDRKRMRGVPGIHGAENVELDPLILQQTDSLHDPVKGSMPPLVFPEGIMKLFRTVHAQAYQEPVFAEETAPLFIKKHAVGLEGVFDNGTGLLVLFLQLHGTPEEIDSHERWLTALPGHGYPRLPVGFEKLPDIGLMHFIRHAKIAIRIKLLFLQEKTVRTVKIALGACRLGHDMKR